MRKFHHSAIASLALLGGLTLAACGSSASTSPRESVFGHVHGIALNPADNKVYVASHHGVFKIIAGRPELVANRAQDTMGFTISGPDTFLASGHPAPGSSEPNPLGFISSGDRAGSWTSLAFRGQEDFHAIDAAGSNIYAYGAEGQLMKSSDGGRTWSTILRAPLIDIAADTTNPDRVLATTETGQLISVAPDQQPAAVAGAPTVVFVDTTSTGVVVGVDPAGRVFTQSGDDSWVEVTSLKSRPEALSVRADTWYAATEAGLFQSADKGDTWTTLTRGKP